MIIPEFLRKEFPVRHAKALIEKVDVFGERKKAKLARDLAYFSEDDLNALPAQIENPIIKTWDHDIFKRGTNVNTVRSTEVDDCLFISLPLISFDENVILITMKSGLRLQGKE